jgi:Fur family ferric uptake transcriptional regulator
MTAAEPLSEEQEVFLKHIQKKGLKRTTQRELILDVFLRTEEHLSNEDLYQLVKKEDPTVGQTTVYRTLKILTEAGLAREVRFGDGRTHYEHNYKHQHHDHMICSECGKIIEFFSAELEAIQDQMAAKHDFEIRQHLLRMIGICSECRREQIQNLANSDDVTDSRNSGDASNPQSSDEAPISRNSTNVANSTASS